MQHTAHGDAIPTVAGVSAADQLPLVDERLQLEWREDLTAGDVRQILAQARLEALKCLAVIQDAAAGHDLAALARSAHKLKGMTGNLGAVRLAALLREIEIGAAAGGESRSALVELESTLCHTLLAFEAGA